MSLANQVEQPAPLSPVVASGAESRSFAGLATALVSGALLSKALGFAREVLMAQVLGASLAADSYRGAVAAVMKQTTDILTVRPTTPTVGARPRLPS